MRYSIFLTGFVASLAAAAPGKKRQAAAAPVFTAQTFADLSIAGGTAGDAAAEAQAKLAGLPADLTTVAPEDVDFLSAVNSIANDAEIAGFNAEIAASQPGEEALALGRGKIKNKVLKLTATMMKLAIQDAQGEDVAAEIEEEQAKLDKNIADDAAEAGAASTDVQFDASTDNPDASEVAKDDALADQASAVLDQSQEAAGGADAGAAADDEAAAGDAANAEDANAEDAAAADDEANAEDANAEDANAEDANAEDANAEDANADEAAAACEDANAENTNAQDDEAAAEDENAQDEAAADEEAGAQDENAQDEAAADEEANAQDGNAQEGAAADEENAQDEAAADEADEEDEN